MTLHDTPDLHELSGPELCRHVGEVAVDAFVAFVAAHSTGPVTPDQLGALAERFRSDHALLAERYRTLWTAAGWTRRGADLPDRRAAPLQRLLVDRFAHLLAPAGSSLTELADGTPAIPRAALPGILAAVATMTPGTLWDQARRRCVDIVASLRMRHGGAFDWEQVEHDAEATELVDDVRMAILPYFADFEKRRRWFITVVDRHQPEHQGPDAAGRPVARQTLLDEAGFDRIFAALYRDLGRRLFDPAGRAALIGRYGSEAVTALARLLERLATGKTRAAAAQAL